jgi:hypothetical protein
MRSLLALEILFRLAYLSFRRRATSVPPPHEALPCAPIKEQIMRILENVAMAAAFLGAQSLAIATILIH